MGIKVHFEDPDYVIGSLCLQAFDTDKRTVAAVAGEPRLSGRSIILSAMMQSECLRLQLIMIRTLPISGNVTDVHSPDAASTITVV